MATLADKAALMMKEQGFKSRCMAAAVQVALTVRDEDENTPFHPLRANFARSFLLNPKDYASQVIAPVANNDAIADAETNTAGSAPDADIVSIISNVWTFIAGGGR